MVSISYTKRKGKKGLTYGYRIADHTGSLIDSKSGFNTKKLAKELGETHKNKLEQGNLITEDILLYNLWERWYDLQIKPSSISETTKRKYRYRGRTIHNIFGDQKAQTLKYRAPLKTYEKRYNRLKIS